MRVAVVGAGGREHALLWKLRQSPSVSELFALPGNAGMRELAVLVPVEMDVTSLISAIERIKAEFVVVGPEQPLGDGLVDKLSETGIPCFGPMAAAARLETSKVFAKELMRDAGVPTAAFAVFDDIARCEDYIKNAPTGHGRVVKADGLAAGKGAFVCGSDQESLSIARSLLVYKSLGTAGSRIVVEEKLAGREASLHFFCDGERFVALPPAQDYKRAYDDDLGGNTGGMGTFCPTEHVSTALIRECEDRIVRPVLQAMSKIGSPYRGLLYVGIMLTENGPQVIEFNCRFGDPETQVMLPCLEYDILEAMQQCARGNLDPTQFSSEAIRHAVCVVMCAEGYPDTYRKGTPLTQPALFENQLLFSAGTSLQSGRWVSSGGRVLNAVGLGETIADARENAYDLAQRALVPGLRMRNDIAATEV